MTEAQLQQLNEKKRDMQLKIKAADLIKHYITYFWLSYLKEMIDLDMHYRIESLFATEDEALFPYLKAAVASLNDPLLDSELVKLGKRTPMDPIFDAFPSLSHFKYVIDLPVLSAYGGDPSAMLLQAKEMLNINDELVHFVSNDTMPVLELRLDELIENATLLFNDGGIITLIFTDPENKWIIFRNIEEEWRCGFWGGG